MIVLSYRSTTPDACPFDSLEPKQNTRELSPKGMNSTVSSGIPADRKESCAIRAALRPNSGFLPRTPANHGGEEMTFRQVVPKFVNWAEFPESIPSSCAIAFSRRLRISRLRVISICIDPTR